MQNNKNPIVFLMWVSGAWKTTVMTELLKLDHLEYIPSYTTRAMRAWEKQWQKYRHISQEVFEDAIKNDEFLEYAFVHNTAYYWTKKQPLYDAQEAGKTPIKEMDLLWLQKLAEQKKITPDMVTIFLDLDDVFMTTRILWRQSDISADELQQRLISANHERELAQKLCTHIIDAQQPLVDVVAHVQKHIQ